MVEGFAKTSRYVLKDGSSPACPLVLHDSPDTHPTVVFGFSDKPEYDAYLEASELALTPYPLVKGYLKNQIALDDGSQKLVVLDATSPKQLVLHVATMQDVLESIELDSRSVAISHQLVFDETLQGYQLQAFVPATTKGLVS